MRSADPAKYTPEQRAIVMDNDTSIRTMTSMPKGGHVVTLGFPGLAFDVTGIAYMDPERLQATLAHSALNKCELLVVLVESEELPDGAFDLLRHACASRHLELVHLPIADYHTPDGVFEAGWAKIANKVENIFQSHKTLALSCHYGAGRSGMMAAKLLIDQGLSAPNAIARLRQGFPESIESDVQLEWLGSIDQAR